MDNPSGTHKCWPLYGTNQSSERSTQAQRGTETNYT